MANFFIEVYCLHGFCDRDYCTFRLIPAGSTVSDLGRDPDYILKGVLKPGCLIPFDQPVQVYTLCRLKPG